MKHTYFALFLNEENKVLVIMKDSVLQLPFVIFNDAQPDSEDLNVEFSQILNLNALSYRQWYFDEGTSVKYFCLCECLDDGLDPDRLALLNLRWISLDEMVKLDSLAGFDPAIYSYLENIPKIRSLQYES